MAEEKLLTVREVSLILDICEKEVVDLAEEGKLPAYKVGGVYLRFKQEQVEEFKKKFIPSVYKSRGLSNQPLASSSEAKNSLKDSLSDFFYFNDFYILSILIILLILLIIFREY